MKNIIKLILLAACSSLMIAGCSRSNADKKPEKENTNSMNQIVYVSVKPLSLTEFNHYLEVQGKIDGDDNVAVSPRNMGVVTKIYVSNGDHVNKDQLLAQLDDEVLVKSQKELQSSLNFATDMYEKQKNLWDKKIGSEVQYLTAKNNKESLENKMVTLKDQIDMMRIKSPIEGNVEDVPIKIGQSVAPGMPAFRVINFSHVKVVAEVAEGYSAKIRTGDDVIIYFPDLEKEIKAKITFSSKYINPINRTFIVEVRLNPNEIEARANLIAVIRINDYKYLQILLFRSILFRNRSKENLLLQLQKVNNNIFKLTDKMSLRLNIQRTCRN